MSFVIRLRLDGILVAVFDPEEMYLMKNGILGHCVWLDVSDSGWFDSIEGALKAIGKYINKQEDVDFSQVSIQFEDMR
jgi:hypothetical protein